MENNWFENHPTKSIILYTITIAAVTWGIFGFLLDDRKDNLHKNEIKLVELKLDSTRTIESQLNARIEILTQENNKIKEQNYRYYEWISNSPNTLAFLEKENNKLRTKNQLNESSQIKQSELDTTKLNPNKVKYKFESLRLDSGSAFIDQLTGASLCVTDVGISNESDGYYNLPNKSQKAFNDLKPGISWDFEYENAKYKIYLKEVDFATGTYKVTIREE